MSRDSDSLRPEQVEGRFEESRPLIFRYVNRSKGAIMRRTMRTLSFLTAIFLGGILCYSQAPEKAVTAERTNGESDPNAVRAPVKKLSKADQDFEMLRRKLNETASLDFFDVPLEDVAQELSDLYKVTFVIDSKALEELALETTEPITKELSGVTLHTALSLILEDLELVLSARDNVFVITTEEAQRMTTRVYETEGLLHSSDSAIHLIDTITTTVEPDSWEELGGQGTISVYQRNLVVSQSFESHLKLVTLLETLKRNIANRGGPWPSKALSLIHI